MSAWRAVLTIGLAGLFLYVVGASIFSSRPTTLYTGVHLRLTGALIQPNVVDVDRGSPAYRAGLRSGDTLSCLSVKDFTLLFSRQIWGEAAGYVPGSAIHACVARDGSTRNVAFVADQRPPNPPEYYSFPLALLRFADYIAFLICGIALVLARPSRMSWIFYTFCLAYAPVYTLLVDGTTQPALLYQTEADIAFIFVRCATPLLLLFALLVPEDRAPGWRRVAYRTAWGILIGVAAFGATASNFIPATMNGRAFTFVTSALPLLVILTVVARLYAMERGERARFGWAAFAIIWGVLCDALRVQVTTHLLMTIAVVASQLTFVMPVTLTYAILRRHVIDVRFVLSRGVVYAVVTTIIVALIGLVDWATGTYLHAVRAALAIDALVTIALGFVLHRTYRFIEYTVDAVLFREKHRGEEYLHRLARTLPFAESEETIDRAIVCAPYEKLALAGVALFRARGREFAPVCAEGWRASEFPPLRHDHALPRFFMAERGPMYVADLHAEMRATLPESSVPAFAVPIFQRNDLTGFVLYGVHHDGTRLDPDEERVLERLCEAAAQAYTGVELDEYRGGARISPLGVGAH